jgi:RNA polymerase sigma factor (sigma-70 family)
MVGVARVLVGPAAAEEIVQEAFIRLIGKLSGLSDQERAAGYLHMTVVNLARGRLRRRAIGMRAAASAPVVQAGQRSPMQPDDAAVKEDQRVRISAALAALSPRQRECMVLRYYAGMTDTETAEAMGIAVGSVKSHVHRAMGAMEKALEVSP